MKALLLCISSLFLVVLVLSIVAKESSLCSHALSENVISITNNRVSVSFDLRKGQLSYMAGERRLIDGAYCAALVNGEERLSTQFTWDSWSRATVTDALGLGSSLVITSTAREGIRLTLEITLYDGKEYAVLEETIANMGQRPVRVDQLKPLAVAANGKFLAGISPRRAVLFLNSYSTVGYRGVVPMLPVPRIAIPGSLPDGTGNLRLGDYSGWWVHVIWNEDNSLGFLSGALTANKWKTWIDVHRDLMSRRFSDWSVNNQGRAILLAGQVFRSEKIMIGTCNDPLVCLDEYGLAIRKINQVQSVPPSLGWCSWPYYYRKITEADILRNASFMKDKLSPAYRYVLIDSGWFTLRGDWQANEKFPEGMKATADKIHALGLEPGLWFAPFLVDKGSVLLQEHSDWFVRNEDESLYRYKQDPSAPDRYVLDGSHPEVQTWLEQLFRTVVNDWGYKYLKLDFLHAGAVEGKRYNPAMTSLEALREGLRAIRRGAGDRAYIQQAIGPWLAPVGILNESRMSMDTEFRLSAGRTTSDISWFNWQYAVWYIRNNIAGYFARGNLFHMLPGEGIRFGPWSFQEAKTLMAAYALNGALWLAGDLTTLSPELVDLLNNRAILDLITSGQAARPVDLFDKPDYFAGIGVMSVFGDGQRLTYRALPNIWYIPGKDRQWVGLFNWRNHSSTITLPVTKLGLDLDRSYSLFDAWTDEKLGECQGSITMVIEAHGHRLLRIE